MIVNSSGRYLTQTVHDNEQQGMRESRLSSRHWVITGTPSHRASWGTGHPGSRQGPARHEIVQTSHLPDPRHAATRLVPDAPVGGAAAWLRSSRGLVGCVRLGD